MVNSYGGNMSEFLQCECCDGYFPEDEWETIEHEPGEHPFGDEESLCCPSCGQAVM